MRERSKREDLRSGEQADVRTEGEGWKGEPGRELTRRMSSDIGVGFREIEYARGSTLEEDDVDKGVTGGLLR